MALSLQSFPQWVQQQAAAIQASASKLVDFTAGSIERAIIEANASVALWVQWLILVVLQKTRLSTSTGADVDSWCADFGLSRLPAIQAPGVVTFSRFTPTLQALISPGVQVKTADGTQIFTVTTDTTSAAWNAGQGGYVIPAGVASVTVPVQAVNAGVQGNIQAGSITLIASTTPNIDTVTNAAAFTNGVDAETDDALKARFQSYIASLVRGNIPALTFAINAVQQGLTFQIGENISTGGAYQPGNFIVYLDDGSGAPSSALLSSVSNAVENYRPLGSTYAVMGPTVISASVAFTIVAASGYSHAALVGPAVLAVTAFVNNLAMGAPLPYSRIAQVVYDSVPGVANVTGITVNGGTADLGGSIGVVVRVSSVVAS
jgi:uncharacterized phage protein gp47/JayE